VKGDQEKMEVKETSVVNALRSCPIEKAKLTILGYLPSAMVAVCPLKL